MRDVSSIRIGGKKISDKHNRTHAGERFRIAGPLSDNVDLVACELRDTMLQEPGRRRHFMGPRRVFRRSRHNQYIRSSSGDASIPAPKDATAVHAIPARSPSVENRRRVSFVIELLVRR